MIFSKITKQLETKGMPVFWQYYIALIAILSAIAFILGTYFIRENTFLNLTNLTIQTLTIVGCIAGYNSYGHRNYPRLILVTGAVFITVSQAMLSLLYLGFPIYHMSSFIVEEQGIVLITIFAFMHMLMLEEKFHIKGLTIDYSLLMVSFVFFFLLISPDTLNKLIYETSIHQQLLILNIFIGSTLLSMSILHYFLSRMIGLTDSIRIILTAIVIIHFGIEIMLTFGRAPDLSIINSLPFSTYSVAAVLTILFIFIEKFSLDFSPVAPSRIGNQLMWVASIIAIVTIPLGLIIRSLLNAPSINLLIIGVAGSLLSTIVIWRFIILISNANEQRKLLKTLIQTNALTGVPNYQGYLEHLTLSRLSNLLVINVNIDDFKSINDLYGRDAADEILKSLATRLKQLPDAILVAHTHSDMFLVVFQTKESNINVLLKKIQDSLGVWDTVQGKQLTVPLSYGASYCKEVANPEKLAKQAEQALKEARNQHTTYSLYIDEKDDNKLPRHELRDILQQSVDQNYLPVHFQPIYNLEDGSLKALELLIRVESEEHGLLLPGQFLEQAKSYGLLTSLTQVCVRMIAKHYATLPDVVININLPPYMLKSQKLLNNFIHLFEEEDLPPNKFCIEITEDEDIPTNALIPAVNKLKEYGFSIAMDDFGTGYSSLDRLSVLAVDTVKIDRSILLTASSGNTAILEWSISLAKRLGISAVVEGVETVEQLSLIKSLGADSVQGFLYSKPVSVLQAIDLPLNSNDISIA
ncbi:MAG: bifunctional diguanylate cyclase/phosphodiesterase [Cocleimonas sp.]|nr:bifunctional diguanylate cyclase/phosphodiesterase [Cocleimonas sp.]